MVQKLLKILKIIVPIAIGVYLTWFFFSGLTQDEIAQVKSAFLDANYFWVAIGLTVAMLSHVSRAQRWLLLIRPLGYEPKLINAFYGVMAGYVINYTIPRSGEFARAGLMTKYENLPFEQGLATIVVERIIDLFMLGLIVVITGYMQVDSTQFDQIIQSQEGGSNHWLIGLFAIGFILGGIGLMIYFKNERFRTFITEKVRSLWAGLTSFRKMKNRWGFVGHTLFIWACYVGGMWVFAQAFTETASMPGACIFGAFVVGAAAIALLPGGLGAYPLWINSVLELYDIHFVGYGIFMWVAITIVIILVGLASLLLISENKDAFNTK